MAPDSLVAPHQPRTPVVRAGMLALAMALSAGVAAAQDNPESLLPAGLDRPTHAPRPRRTPPPPAEAPAARPAVTGAPRIEAAPIVAAPSEPTPGFSEVPAGNPVVAGAGRSRGGSPAALGRFEGIGSYAQLLALPPDQLDALLGLSGRSDVPAGARRALSQVGVMAESEGGFPAASLGSQDAALVRAALVGNSGEMVSRWGHILLRRALASRLDAPAGMAPADFAAMRAALLVRMGESDAARALVQDIDPDNYNPALADAALAAYTGTADFTGICPILAQGVAVNDSPQWGVSRAVCQVFSGNAGAGMHDLDRLTYKGALPHIDMLLAQKYAGAAGGAAGGGRGGRRAVTIEWGEAEGMNPWRYGLALAVGLEPPASLMRDAGAQYAYAGALAPALGLGARADAGDVAAGAGVLSAAAMVDLYSQIFADDGVTGDAAERASGLRACYVADGADDRLKAMQQLWDGGKTPAARYGRQVLTAYAAARLPVSGDLAAGAGDVIASMLAAGLDANALRWMHVVDVGSPGWGQVVLAAPMLAQPVDAAALNAFRKNDVSTGNRKSAFLAAGLAGLGRVNDATRDEFGSEVGAGLGGATHWTRTLDAAARVGNGELVALLAGLGMQGSGWDRMTPRALYHIVAALNRTGMSGEARMIAAEAVARG